MAAVGRRVTPFIDCILGDDRSDCMIKIASGQADVMSVSPKEAFHGSRQVGSRSTFRLSFYNSLWTLDDIA